MIRLTSGLLFLICCAQGQQHYFQKIPKDTLSRVSVCLPRFEDYSVSPPALQTVAKIDFKSDPKARRYRTVLREGAVLPPDFAGRCKVVSWGCGSPCHEFAIVDLKTGLVYVSPEGYSVGIGFRLDSNLLVLEPEQDYRALCEQGMTIFCEGGPSAYYRWTGRQLRLVEYVNVPPMTAPVDSSK
jgi:hypothetical protein